MRLPCCPKILLHSDVELLISAGEPASATTGEFLRLFQFFHPKHFPEEPARLRLASRRRSYLHMIDSLDHLSIIANVNPASRPVI